MNFTAKDVATLRARTNAGMMDCKQALTACDGDFEKAIINTVPLSTTQKEQILAIREWANVRAVCASSKENIENYKNIIHEEDDITTARGGRRLDI